MIFVLEYVKTLQVLSSLVLCRASITVTLAAHCYLRGGIHITCLGPVS